ncbi:MAG: RIO1 family regulatory kinase/ATPase [Candidatus Hodarchaeota archaeon]
MKAAEIVKMLSKKDLLILQTVEQEMRRYEYVPLERIEESSELNHEEIVFQFNRLSKLGLVSQKTTIYTGYGLKVMGYDCLALSTLVDRGVLEALGKPLGVGKEADVYDALTPKGERVAVKFLRIGRPSFKHIRRSRDYAAKGPSKSWLGLSKLTAKKEYLALNRLFDVGVAVPMPIAQDRHVVVMSAIEGAELHQCKALPKPSKMLDHIIENIALAFNEAQVVHGDLSEFNILITPTADILIIDWGQWIDTRFHRDWRFYLERDINNVLKYFKRKYNEKRDLKIIVETIIAE